MDKAREYIQSSSLQRFQHDSFRKAERVLLEPARPIGTNKSEDAVEEHTDIYFRQRTGQVFRNGWGTTMNEVHPGSSLEVSFILNTTHPLPTPSYSLGLHTMAPYGPTPLCMMSNWLSLFRSSLRVSFCSLVNNNDTSCGSYNFTAPTPPSLT